MINTQPPWHRFPSAAWNGALSDDAITHLQTRLGVALPADYAAFLRDTDGGAVDDLTLLDAASLMFADDRATVLPFHDWGNGDFDCFVYSRAAAAGYPVSGAVLKANPVPATLRVCFMNHNPGVLVEVAPSFTAWLEAVLAELAAHGDVAHPGDYRSLERDGVHAHVLTALDGVDCELNS